VSWLWCSPCRALPRQLVADLGQPRLHKGAEGSRDAEVTQWGCHHGTGPPALTRSPWHPQPPAAQPVPGQPRRPPSPRTTSQLPRWLSRRLEGRAQQRDTGVARRSRLRPRLSARWKPAAQPRLSPNSRDTLGRVGAPSGCSSSSFSLVSLLFFFLPLCPIITFCCCFSLWSYLQQTPLRPTRARRKSGSVPVAKCRLRGTAETQLH